MKLYTHCAGCGKRFLDKKGRPTTRGRRCHRKDEPNGVNCQKRYRRLYMRQWIKRPGVKERNLARLARWRKLNINKVRESRRKSSRNYYQRHRERLNAERRAVTAERRITRKYIWNIKLKDYIPNPDYVPYHDRLRQLKKERENK